MSKSTENEEKVSQQSEEFESEPVTEMGNLFVDQTNMVTEKIQIKSVQEMCTELPNNLKSPKPKIVGFLFTDFSGCFFEVKITVNGIENSCVAKALRDPNDIRRQLRRFISSQKLDDHPNIVKIKMVYLKMDGAAPELYLIMDHFEKCLYSTLMNTHQVSVNQKIITPSNLPFLHRIRYAFQIANGLAYLHSHEPQIFHGNLKPDHVLIIGRKAKLYNMRFMDSDDIIDKTGTKASTEAGRNDGYRYDAPEYTNREKDANGNYISFQYTTQCDVYSAGAIFFWLVTGFPPWKCAALFQMTAQPLRNTLKPQEGCPEWLFELCKECIDPEPANRPKDGAAIVAKILAGIKKEKDGAAILAEILQEIEGPKDGAAKCG